MVNKHLHMGSNRLNMGNKRPNTVSKPQHMAKLSNRLMDNSNRVSTVSKHLHLHMASNLLRARANTVSLLLFLEDLLSLSQDMVNSQVRTHTDNNQVKRDMDSKLANMEGSMVSRGVNIASNKDNMASSLDNTVSKRAKGSMASNREVNMVNRDSTGSSQVSMVLPAHKVVLQEALLPEVWMPDTSPRCWANV
jgi:hypothetical protein